MAKITTLIGINNLTAVDQLAYANHIQFFYRLGRNLRDTHDFILCNPRRMSIDRMRNECAKIALEHEIDYILFLDDDVLVPFDGFFRLASHNKDVIAGVTHVRGYPFPPMIFDFKQPGYYVLDYKQRAGDDGLLKCDAVGFSFCLIRTNILKDIPPPYFVTSLNQTEDIFFCIRAKEHIKGLEIWVDTTVETGHLLGNDIVSPSDVEHWRQFEELRCPEIKAPASKRGDRSEDYIREIVEN